MSETAIFEKLAIIGAGMIGSSVAQAARLTGAVNRIVMTDRCDSVLREANALSLADDYTQDAAEAVVGADLVMLAVPVGAMGVAAETILPFMRSGAILSDVGSVKGDVLSTLDPLVPGDIHLIPGHPVAGTEKSGPSAGIQDLFDGRWCILTPPPGADQSAVEKLSAFWERLGSKVETMDAAHHDRVLAITSHLPHLIAYNIVGTASDLEEVTRSEVIKYSAGGFRDFTRIAASDPVMWRDVFLTNKEAVLEMLGRFTEDLTALQRAIRWGEGESLEKLFSRTRDIRTRIIDAGQDEDVVDFGRHHTDSEGKEIE
ncbi:prephenate/arogenate dehydrogenase family protein [Temperatibacter marinus]|uniref:prephenate dehydrogenase n=1 Tax=Temperatibacter marinus TaxID=1456591 RepID=A0AA52HBR4_9PROT|nr:prephenate/arogenate dehydrogenase family protein [Temperatibacter marinus]WND04025.1 prephenate/arogenate dehydrogenase family protein [Temperatibacter marinus]